ncbi:hypothetical protein XELAEV_18030688mg [Xenopus laevis]|uniref:Uncharacterized protein n=1 Tax=Xenopus laevis TaxID=8355 RepID=A0A974CMF9_XENLA|nr:hypothetical protein XELAEV_18030688mg [Xenopus laevis]
MATKFYLSLLHQGDTEPPMNERLKASATKVEKSIRSILPCATERQWEKTRETCCIMFRTVAAAAKSKFIICLDTKINIYLVGNEDLLRSGS